MKKSTFGSISNVGLWELFGAVIATLKQLIIFPIFGATGNTDAFFASSQLSRRMSEFLGFEIMKGGLISHYSGLTEKEILNRNFSALLNFLLLFGGGIVILLIAFAEPILGLIVKGFDSDIMALSVRMSRLVFPVILLIGLNNLFSSLLTALHVYNVSGKMRVVINIVMIGCTLALYRSLGAYALAVGYLAGWVASTLYQLPLIFKSGVRYHPVFKGQWQIVKMVIVMLSPLMLGLFVSQINAFVQLRLASELAVGKVTAMNLSLALYSTMIVVLTQPFLLVLLPRISKNNKEMPTKLIEYTDIFAFIFIPISFFLFSQSELIISVVFGRGDFDQRAIEITASAFRAYAAGFFFWAQTLLQIQFFLAEKRTRVIGIVDFVTVSINIGLNFLLVHYWDLFGLVLALSIAYAMRFVIYTFILGNASSVPQQLLSALASAAGFIALNFVDMSILVKMLNLSGVIGEISLLGLNLGLFTLVFMLLAFIFRLNGPYLAFREIKKTGILRRS